MENATSSGVLVAGWHRMGYTFNHSTLISKELEIHIRQLHNIVRNAVTEWKYIVFGVGSTQLVNAAIRALSTKNSSSPTRVVASIPYYPVRFFISQHQIISKLYIVSSYGNLTVKKYYSISVEFSCFIFFFSLLHIIQYHIYVVRIQLTCQLLSYIYPKVIITFFLNKVIFLLKQMAYIWASIFGVHLHYNLHKTIVYY